MRKQIPFFKQITLYAKKIKKVESKASHSPPTTKLLSSPKMLSKFAPVSPMIKRDIKGPVKEGLKTSSVLAKLTGNVAEEAKGKGEDKRPVTHDEAKVEASKTMKAQHVPWIDSSKAKDIIMSPNMNTEVIRLPNTIKVNQSLVQKIKDDKSELLKSPSLFLRDASKDSTGGVIYCGCGRPCEGDNTLCSECMRSKESVEHSGYLYVKTKSTKLKRYWYILLNKELYCNSIFSCDNFH